MNKRDLVVILSAHKVKIVLVSDELRSQYAVSERFEPSGLLFQEYSIVTDLIEDIEDQIGIPLLDSDGVLMVGNKEMAGIRGVHLVVLPDYFLNTFVIALSQLSLHRIQRIVSSLPITSLYSSHLMEFDAESMISSFNTIHPEFTILTGGEDDSPVLGLVTLADYLSLVHSDKTENSIAFIGSSLEKDDVFKRLATTFSLSHFPSLTGEKNELIQNIRHTVQQMLLTRIQRHLPEFEPLFSVATTVMISDNIEEQAKQVSLFYEENSLVVYYAISFAAYAVSWKEDGRWLSDIKIIEYRDMLRMKEYPALKSLFDLEYHDTTLLEKYAGEILTVATQSIDEILSAGLSDEKLFDAEASYVFADILPDKKRKYMCKRLVYGGDLTELVDNKKEFFSLFSTVKALDSFVHLYRDSEQQFLVFSALSLNGSEQANMAIEQDVEPQLSFQGFILTPDRIESVATIKVDFLLFGGEIDVPKTDQLRPGYRHFFLLQPKQRASIEISGGTLGGKRQHNFVCEGRELHIYIDLRTE